MVAEALISLLWLAGLLVSCAVVAVALTAAFFAVTDWLAEREQRWV